VNNTVVNLAFLKQARIDWLRITSYHVKLRQKVQIKKFRFEFSFQRSAHRMGLQYFVINYRRDNFLKIWVCSPPKMTKVFRRVFFSL
jgi:ABC-type oligopeptide transport system substrate-binding subunit